MDARLHGFRLGSTQTCTLRDLSNYLTAIKPEVFDFHNRDRMLFAGERDGKCVGVLLSLKDQRRFPEIERGEELKLFVHEAEEGRSPFDFNFFALDPETGAGLYQHYRSSCSIHRFGDLMGRLYDDLARNQCVGDTNILLARESGHRLRSDKLEFAVVYTRDNFEELVQRLDRAVSFQYDIVTQEDMSQSFIPLRPHAQLERRTVKFKSGTRGVNIIDGIKALLPSAARRGMFRVIGTDDEGDICRVDFMSPPADEFAKDDVDSLADEVILTFNDITKSPYVDTMIQVLQDNPGLFGPEADS